jgi:hypothetical protein
VFAETISLDAWRTPFDGDKGEAEPYVDVVFAERGRVGGGADPVRFRLSLKRAEVVVLRDNENIIEVDRLSILRATPPTPAKVRHATKQESELSGSLGGALSPAAASLSLKASTAGNVNVIDTLEHEQAVTRMEITHWKTADGYSFRIAARAHEPYLTGQPWQASTPLMKLRDTNARRKRGEPPELRIEIHCLREDLVIEDIEFTSGQFNWSALTRNRQIAVEQFIKDELARSGLPCGDLSEPPTGSH